MFTNSLFCDYLKENGMKVWKDESTRDIICLEFNYGSRSYKEELLHLRKVASSARREHRIANIRSDKYLMDKSQNKRNKITGLLEIAHGNKNNYQAFTNEELRTLYYNNGVDVEYITRDRNGNIKKREVIHYKMLFRSTGKAKKGSCMFIRDKLYKKARNMGIIFGDARNDNYGILRNDNIVHWKEALPIKTSGRSTSAGCRNTCLPARAAMICHMPR